MLEMQKVFKASQIQPLKCRDHNYFVQYFCLDEKCINLAECFLCHECYDSHSGSHKLNSQIISFSYLFSTNLLQDINQARSKQEDNNSYAIEKIEDLCDSLTKIFTQIIAETKINLKQSLSSTQDSRLFQQVKEDFENIIRKYGKEEVKDITSYLQEFSKVYQCFRYILKNSKHNSALNSSLARLTEESNKLKEFAIHFGQKLNVGILGDPSSLENSRLLKEIALPKSEDFSIIGTNFRESPFGCILRHDILFEEMADLRREYQRKINSHIDKFENVFDLYQKKITVFLESTFFSFKKKLQDLDLKSPDTLAFVKSVDEIMEDYSDLLDVNLTPSNLDGFNDCLQKLKAKFDPMKPHHLMTIPQNTQLFSENSKNEMAAITLNSTNVIKMLGVPIFVKVLPDNSGFYLNNIAHLKNFNMLAFGNQNGIIYLFDLKALEIVKSVKVPHEISSMHYSSQNSFLVLGCRSGYLYVYSLPKLELVSMTKFHNFHRQWLCFIKEITPDVIVLSDDDNEILIFNLITRKVLYRLHDKNTINAILYVKEKGLLLAGTRMGKITVFNFHTKKLLVQKVAHSPDRYMCCMAYDALTHSVMSGSYDGTLVKWYLEDDGNLTNIYTIKQQDGCIVTDALIFSREDIMISLHCDKFIRKWKYSTGELMSKTQLSGIYASCLKRIEDSDYVVVGDLKHGIVHFVNYKLI